MYKLRSIGVGGQFLSMVPKFHSDRRQRVRLVGKVNVSVNVVSGVARSVLGPLLFILYTSKLFCKVGNHIVVYADDITIYAVIPSPRPRVRITESGIYPWRMKWHMRLNPKKTKSIVVNRFRTYTPDLGNVTLGGA